MHSYTVYGRTFSCARPFQARVAGSVGPSDYRLTYVDSPPWSSSRWSAAERISPEECLDSIEIRRDGAGWAMHVPDASMFSLEDREFNAWIARDDHQVLGEIHFLDNALPFALELENTPFVHASAVEWDGKAIAFSAFAGGGKSSITTSLVLRGAKFLTDDVLVLERRDADFLAHPGYPQIRLWDDAAGELLPADAHEMIHATWPKRRGLVERFGEFAKSPSRLSALFLLDTETKVEAPTLERISGQAAFFRLLKNLPALAALDYSTQAIRTKFFGELLASVPVLLLRYPRRYDLLDDVLNVVLAEVERCR